MTDKQITHYMCPTDRIKSKYGHITNSLWIAKEAKRFLIDGIKTCIVKNSNGNIALFRR